MGSMHTGLEEPGMFAGNLEEMAAYFGERAKGDVGLIVTGGIAPNDSGKGYFGAAKMSTMSESAQHRCVTEAVHAHGGKIADLAVQTAERDEDVLDGADFGDGLLGAFTAVPEIRSGHFRFEEVEFFGFGSDVKETPSSVRGAHGPRPLYVAALHES